MMTLADILPRIQSLPREEKLRLIQLLAADVAREEAVPDQPADQTISLWSPHDAFEGAAALLRVLDHDEATG